MQELEPELELYFQQRLIFEKKVRKFFDVINERYHLCSVCFAMNNSCCHPIRCNKELDSTKQYSYSFYTNTDNYDVEYRKWVMKNFKKDKWRNEKLHKGCPLNLGKSMICITHSCPEMMNFFKILSKRKIFSFRNRKFKSIVKLLDTIYNVDNLKAYKEKVKITSVMDQTCNEIDQLFSRHNLNSYEEIDIERTKFGWQIKV